MVRRLILTLACSLSLLSGCASVTHVQAGRHDQFRNALVDSCHSIQISEFQTARRQLDQARNLAQGQQQRQKVMDLEHMLDGAKALHDGHPRKAATAWLAIRNTALRQQVVGLADAEGINLIALAEDGSIEKESSQ
ncbi:MAG: hypothetical protein P8M22_05315 [Phycisphaerales bacterium]|nr:hypothetical protein [Phycisphaerales bacterium]